MMPVALTATSPQHTAVVASVQGIEVPVARVEIRRLRGHVLGNAQTPRPNFRCSHACQGREPGGVGSGRIGPTLETGTVCKVCTPNASLAVLGVGGGVAVAEEIL